MGGPRPSFLYVKVRQNKSPTHPPEYYLLSRGVFLCYWYATGNPGGAEGCFGRLFLAPWSLLPSPPPPCWRNRRLCTSAANSTHAFVIGACMTDRPTGHFRRRRILFFARCPWHKLAVAAAATTAVGWWACRSSLIVLYVDRTVVVRTRVVSELWYYTSACARRSTPWWKCIFKTADDCQKAKEMNIFSKLTISLSLSSTSFARSPPMTLFNSRRVFRVLARFS